MPGIENGVSVDRTELATRVAAHAKSILAANIEEDSLP
jgi:hypothetical protein